jgi:hypothetical protein
MVNSEFAVFILTHGRPDKVVTYKTLQRCGYTGPVYFIVDNEDVSVDKYRSNFGADRVIVFDKKAMADQVDEGNNFDERRTITHARNACFDIAERLGFTYFMQLDDDYTDFRYKLIETNNSLFIIKDMDRMLDQLIGFYVASGATSIALAQNGDFIGGFDNGMGIYRFAKRKCMNSFLCSTMRRFQFVGAMNEDVNTFTVQGAAGSLFMTIPFVALNQKQTQSQVGGITDMYLKYGTYCKAFTTVMMQPSSVRVSMMNSNNPRIHHTIDWPNTVPVIIDERYKKN